MKECMRCKETEDRKMYNSYICIPCRSKWERDFYDRLKKKAAKK